MSFSIEDLTEPQRACLRLVHQHMSSKEIAQLLDVSPSAIDKRIERAVMQLGASSRFHAARLLALHEKDDSRSPGPLSETETTEIETYDRITSYPIDMASGGSRDEERRRNRSLGPVSRLFGLGPDGRGETGPRNTFSRSDRIALAIALACLIAMSSLAMLAMGETLTGFLERHGVHLS